MSFDAHQQARSSKNVLIAAESNMSDKDHDSSPQIAAQLVRTIHDSLCKLSTDERNDTVNAMSGILDTPLNKFNAMANASKHSDTAWAESFTPGHFVQIDHGNYSKTEDRTTSSPLATNEKAFLIERDGNGEPLGLTFRWNKTQPLISISLDNCNQK